MKSALLAFAVLVAMPASAETVALVGGTVAIGDGSAPIPGGTVLFRDGRIVAAGAQVAVPPSATVVDARGKWVSPGLVAGLTNLGLADSDGIEESNDTSADKSPFAAAIDVSTAINPDGVIIGIERASGITSALVSPGTGGSIFAGQGAVITLGLGDPPVSRPRAFQYVELGEDGGRTAGGSRPAAYAMFRDALAEAQDYRRNPAGFGGRDRGSLIKRGDAAALLPVIDGRMPLLVHVERASDILSVLALTHEYPQLKLVLVGVSEGWMVAPQIATAHVPVIAAALVDLPEAFERVAATESNVGRMERAGIWSRSLPSMPASRRSSMASPSSQAISSRSRRCRGRPGSTGATPSRRSPRGRRTRSAWTARSARCAPVATPTSCCGTATRSNSPRRRWRCGSAARRSRCAPARPSCATAT